ncbi:MAG: phosphonate C-P lyase system protein PhnH [Pseudomonadota bacterium]
MQSESMQGGFANAPVDAAVAFRAAIEAMSRPGVVQSVAGAVAPGPMSQAAAVLAMTLCDPDTPVWLTPSLDNDAIRGWFRFHTGAPLVGRAEAMFAFGQWEEMLPITDFSIGTPEYPDRSATLIVEVPEIGKAHTLSGPGIRETASLTVPDLHAVQLNSALFPLGLDFFLCTGDRLAALPRTTKVEG